MQARSTAFRGGEGDGSFAFGSETLEMVVTLYVPPGAAAGEADSKKFELRVEARVENAKGKSQVVPVVAGKFDIAPLALRAAGTGVEVTEQVPLGNKKVKGEAIIMLSAQTAGPGSGSEAASDSLSVMSLSLGSPSEETSADFYATPVAAPGPAPARRAEKELREALAREEELKRALETLESDPRLLATDIVALEEKIQQLEFELAEALEREEDLQAELDHAAPPPANTQGHGDELERVRFELEEALEREEDLRAELEHVKQDSEAKEEENPFEADSGRELELQEALDREADLKAALQQAEDAAEARAAELDARLGEALGTQAALREELEAAQGEEEVPSGADAATEAALQEALAEIAALKAGADERAEGLEAEGLEARARVEDLEAELDEARPEPDGAAGNPFEADGDGVEAEGAGLAEALACAEELQRTVKALEAEKVALNAERDRVSGLLVTAAGIQRALEDEVHDKAGQIASLSAALSEVEADAAPAEAGAREEEIASEPHGAPAASEVLQENEELRMGLIEAKLSLAEADTEGHQLKRMLSKAVQKQIKLAEALTVMESRLYKATGTFK